MAYVNIRNNIALSAVNCYLNSLIEINYGVNDLIIIYADSGYSFSASANRLSCMIFHTNGTAEAKTVSKYASYCAITYGGGTNDKNGDIIFIWGYGAFLPTYPTLTNNITAPNGVTFSSSTAITTDNEFWFFVTPRVNNTDAIGYTFKDVIARYHDSNGETTETATIKNFTNGLKRVFCKLTDYNTAYDTILNGVCGISLTVGNYVTNGTISGLPSEVLSGEQLNLTVAAANGYYFDTAPICRIYAANSVLIDTFNFTLTANGINGTLTADLSDYPSAVYIEFSGTAILQPVPEFSFINNVQNSTLSTSVNGNTFTATITANSSRLAFTTQPTAVYYVSGVETIANLTVSEVNNIVTATITATADIGRVTINGVLDRRVIFDDTTTHTTINGVTTDYFFINQTYNLEFAAATDYCYETAPKLVVWGVDIQGEEITAVLDNNDPHLSASLSFNLTTIFGDDVTNILSIDVVANGVPITSYNYGAINVYKVNADILNRFAAARYFWENNLAIDLGNYVITLKRLYFSVGTTVSDVIKCANYNTQIAATTPTRDTMTINCGAVTIPQYNNNIVDYSAEITAFLPFVGFVNIPSDYVGKTVNLTYICSAVTGKGFAKLDYNGIVFDTYAAAVSDNLVFKAITDNAEINQLEFNKYNGLQPYVIVKHFNDLTRQIVNNDNLRGVLSTFSGYVECTEIENLSAVLPSEIKDLIKKELRNGVYL